jgi:hypothetical protein
MICQTLSRFDNYENLVKEVNSLLERFPSSSSNYQLGLQVTDPNDTSDSAWTESVGRITKNGVSLIESDFKHINPALAGGYIDQWLQSLSEYNLVRARLMCMSPRVCYSIHADPTPRIHLPIITDPQAIMIFPRAQRIFHMPADGHSYLVDTTQHHTLANCSEIVRIHLVAVVSQVQPSDAPVSQVTQV